jgi:hypothetical protein
MSSPENRSAHKSEPAKATKWAKDDPNEDESAYKPKDAKFFTEGRIFRISCPDNQVLNMETWVVVIARSDSAQCLKIHQERGGTQEEGWYNFHARVLVATGDGKTPSGDQHAVLRSFAINLHPDQLLEGNCWVNLQRSYDISYDLRVVNCGELKSNSGVTRLRDTHNALYWKR